MDQKNKLLKKEEEEEDKVKVEGQKDYRPFIQQDEHDSSSPGDFMTIDQRETMRELDDSQLVGPPPPPAAASTALVVKRDVHMADVQAIPSPIVPHVTSAYRKRGRPPRALGKIGPSSPPPPPPQRKQPAVVDDEEDVCFICFDGGSLVLCDRRGCPKAYHPACIKRDEAFFRSKAKWNCGWHICSSCQKASHYMCYTCTYSLCKGCTKDADYVCVRGNKGFCAICMKTIMLIENVSLANVEQVQVDFDDKTSWEYLFKVYWVYLKDKLSLTVDELIHAKNPWKGDELPKARNSWRRNGIAAQKDIVAGQPFHANNEKISCLENCNGNGEGTLSKRRKTNDQSDQLDQEMLHNEKNTILMEKPTVEKVTPLSEGRTWATKALLEFVAHMKDGDSSVLSQVDIQALVLEYVNRNNLRDPRQNSQIVCDARLLNLFRKPRVSNLEMLKLLEYHFLTKEKPQPDAAVRITVDNAPSSQLEASNCDATVRITVDNAPSSQLEASNCDATVRTTDENALSSQLEGASNCDATVRTTVENALSSQLEGARDCDSTVRTTVDNVPSSQLEGASNCDAAVRTTVDNALSSQLEGPSNCDSTVLTTVDNAHSSQLEGASNCDATVRTTVDNALSSQLEGASNRDATLRTTVDNALSSQLEGASNHDATVRTTVDNALSSQLEGASNHDATVRTTVDNALSSQLEASNCDATVRTRVDNALSSQLKGASSGGSQQAMVNDKTRKTRKKMNEKGSPVNPNPDEYAAIDAHNINLLYLKRNLMENLLDDAENFHEKVVGSFVRIRIPLDGQKRDVHRLVQVVGTCKEDESYKVGSRTINIKLEILNLDKKEVISIDGISDQDFSEDECRRLRQSINFGLMKRLKVGEIEEKAMVLQPVKVNHCLEAEILRLSHLRDRAREKKRRKEVKECAGKIELLRSPKERERRLLQIPSVHMDPRMDPSHVTKDDARERDHNKQSDHVRLNSTGVVIKGIELNSSPGEGDLNDVGHRALKTLAAASEQVRNVEMKFCVDPEASVQIHERENDSASSQGAGTYGLNSQNASKNELGGADSVTVDWSSAAPVTSESAPGSELSVNDFEGEKLWHYQDPSGKIQGPFSMMQLRKWSEIKIFPDDFRVWKINEKQHDSILLADALIGRFPKEPLQPQNILSLPQVETVACNDADKKWEHGLRQGTDVTRIDNKRADHDQKPLKNDVQIHGNSNDELAKSNELASHSISWIKAADAAVTDDAIHGNNNDEVAKSNGLASHSISWIKAADAAVTGDAQARSSLQVWELSEDSKSVTGQSQICNSLPAPSSSGKSYEPPLLSERERHKDEKWSLKSSTADKSSHLSTSQANAKDNHERRVGSEGHSGENWRPQSMNSVTSEWDPNSSFLSMLTSIEKSEQNQKINFSNMPSTASMQDDVDLKNQVAENKLSGSSNVPVQDSGPPSWSTGSSLVIGGRQVPEVAVEWLGYSSTPAKRSVEHWDPNLVSASSLKPTERTADHAAMPTLGTDQLTLSSSNHPTIDASGWQPIVPEPNEFCSLVDESVSDLLAEVEAMESLGLPSPTSKMRYDLELTPGSDDDCFSPVERFSPARDQGKSDALSSTGDIQMPSQLSVVEESLRLSLMPSQPTIIDEQLAASQMSAQLAAINKPHPLAQIPRQSIVLNGPLRASHMPSQSPLNEEPLRLWQRDLLDPQKSFSGRSSSSAEVDGDAKRSEVSVNQWDIGLEIRPMESTVRQRQSGLDFQPPTTSTVRQWDDGSSKQHPASTADASRRSDKGNANLNRGVAQGNANSNMVWSSGHGSIQQQGSTNSGILGSQPRYGGESRHSSQREYSGQREHRNHSQSRDSGSGRDRSSWNSRQATYGAGNGGSSFKAPSKGGQRICKFYESGYCKRGASCSFWHP